MKLTRWWLYLGSVGVSTLWLAVIVLAAILVGVLDAWWRGLLALALVPLAYAYATINLYLKEPRR